MEFLKYNEFELQYHLGNANACVLSWKPPAHMLAMMVKELVKELELVEQFKGGVSLRV